MISAKEGQTDSHDKDDSMACPMLNLLRSIAVIERSLVHQHQAGDIVVARRRGDFLGRAPYLRPQQRTDAECQAKSDVRVARLSKSRECGRAAPYTTLEAR